MERLIAIQVLSLTVALNYAELVELGNKVTKMKFFIHIRKFGWFFRGIQVLFPWI